MTNAWFYFSTMIIYFMLYTPLLAKNTSPPVSPQQPNISSNKTASKTKPLQCPQCGIWQVGEVDLLIIDKNRIIIPGCGKFNYKTRRSISIPDNEDRHTYKVSMLLQQSSTSFLCENGDKKDWLLDVNVNGHFREGSTAEFELRKRKKSKPTLTLRGWNTDRENPCDAGSSKGSLACSLIEYSYVYKAISNKTVKAYEVLINRQVKKLPDFNTARFTAVVDQFCTEREKESGSFSWPTVWALDCQLDIMRKKYQEFIVWEKCVEKNKNTIKVCKFPKESFKRDQTTSVEQQQMIKDKEENSHHPPQYRSFGPLEGFK